MEDTDEYAGRIQANRGQVHTEELEKGLQLKFGSTFDSGCSRGSGILKKDIID